MNTEQTPKIINMTMCMPPAQLKNDVQLLATFGAIMWPIRADNLRLVRHKGELKIWTQTPDLRILSTAKPVIIEAAMETVRKAMDEIEQL